MKVPVDISVRYSAEGLTGKQATHIFLDMQAWIFDKFGRSPSMTETQKDGELYKEWKVDWVVEE